MHIIEFTNIIKNTIHLPLIPNKNTPTSPTSAPILQHFIPTLRPNAVSPPPKKVFKDFKDFKDFNDLNDLKVLKDIMALMTLTTLKTLKSLKT